MKSPRPTWCASRFERSSDDTVALALRLVDRHHRGGNLCGVPPVTRYASKVDATHREVVDTLRQYGWLVHETHRLPGFVDAVGYGHAVTIGLGRRMHLIEIKSSAKADYTEGQKKMIADGWPILTLTSAADVRRLMGDA